jgi:hypothetical protein
MRAMFLALITAIPAVAAPPHYLDVYNTAPSSLVSIGVAPAGTTAFRITSFADRPIGGGGDSVTVAIDSTDADCIRDLRLAFADGRVLMQKGFNVCRFRSYHTGRYWRSAVMDSRFTAQH